LILGRFLEQGYDRLDGRQRELFERLLDCEDDRLQLWLLSSEAPADAELAEIVAIVRQPR
jgi:antitoxin CptB